MPTPKKFGFIRATLALWAADIGTFVRGGVVSDSPNGGNAWGVNIPGVGWIYAAMRDSDEHFNSVDSLTNYRVNGTSVIDSSRNVKGATLWSGGSIRVDGNGDFSGCNQTLTGWLTVGGSARLGWGGAASGAIQISSSSGFYAAGSAIRWTRGLYFDGSNFINTSTEYAQIFRLDSDGGVVIATQDNAPAANGVANITAKWTLNRFGGMGCFGVTPPTTRPTVNAAATDLATVIALTNQLRSVLIACGLVQ